MWQIYKYQPVNKYVLSNLANKKIWYSKPEAFNDPFEFRLQRKNKVEGLEKLREQQPHLSHLSNEEIIELAVDEYEKTVRSMGVACFTELPDDIQMWSYYADAHKGICLGFCGNKEGESINDAALYQVSYEVEYPELTFSEIWHRDGLAKILWTKEKAWQHEKEWRSIQIDGNKLVDYVNIKLNRVIFGLQTSEIDKNLVRSVLINDNENIDLLQVRRNNLKYKLEIELAT